MLGKFQSSLRKASNDKEENMKKSVMLPGKVSNY
jgi:hypothetical protein